MSGCAVLFDLDGTLWDAADQTYGVWNQVFARHPELGLSITPRQKTALMGRTMEEIGEALFPQLEAARRNALMDECGVEEVRSLRRTGGTLYDGLRETLHALNRTRELYIVSNCQSGYVEAFLDAHDLADQFRDYEMAGRTGRGKGENIRLVMARNGVRRAVFVGDTEGDERAAAFAGLPFIHAAYGFGTAKRPAAVIRSIAELPRVLEALEETTTC